MQTGRQKLTEGEIRQCQNLICKMHGGRNLLNDNELQVPFDLQTMPGWFNFLSRFKDIFGTMNNDIAFVATLLAKNFLITTHGLRDNAFDASLKHQNANGLDIAIALPNGARVICEIKTTVPLRNPTRLGRAQTTAIEHDLERLADESAAHKYMMVTNHDAFTILGSPVWHGRTVGITLVDLLTGETHPQTEVVALP